ncbi:MAG: M4 family metallopeptidase [Candidatus Aminicenantales bacterium]
MKQSTKVKIALGALVCSLLTFSMGSIQERSRNGRADLGRVAGEERAVFASLPEEIKPLSVRMDAEILKGNLKPALTQVENLGVFVHERYDVYHKGLKVWGAQLLRHRRNGQVYLINGDLIEGIDLDVTPTVTADQAAQMARTGLTDPAYKLDPGSDLMIYPEGAQFILAYRVTYAKFDSRIITFIDAKTGRIVFRHDDVNKTTAIGKGTGILGDTKKMSTESADGTFYAIDGMRPAQIITADMRHSTSGSAYYVTDSDNNWTSDGTVVDGHAYLGWTYDYYYLVHGRKGMDDNNRQLVLVVHLGNNYQNAFYNPSTKFMYFGDGDPNSAYPYSTALDIVAHEFTHGVTDATSDLIYVNESGALNEAFSDIMAVSCEFLHQSQGAGYLKADWLIGEDQTKDFQPMRNLADPASILIWSGYNYRYPDHYTKRLILPATEDGDWGGVHINCMIASHWFYLLAQGGTNRTSGISVSGIGLAKAEAIAYRTWAYYLRPSSTFAGARTASLQAAAALYGAGSAEAQAVARAWSAVGIN